MNTKWIMLLLALCLLASILMVWIVRCKETEECLRFDIICRNQENEKLHRVIEEINLEKSKKDKFWVNLDYEFQNPHGMDIGSFETATIRVLKAHQSQIGELKEQVLLLETGSEAK